MSTRVYYRLYASINGKKLGMPQAKDQEKHRKMTQLHESCLENEIDLPPKVISYIQELCGEFPSELYLSMMRHGVMDIGEDGFYWNEEEKAMRAVSKENPHVLLSLHLRYPEYDDEMHYYMEGKMQVVKEQRTFPDFNPSKAK